MGVVKSEAEVPVGGAGVLLTPLSGGRGILVQTNAEGIFRVGELVPGTYSLEFRSPGFEPLAQSGIDLHGGELLTIEIRLKPATKILLKDRTSAEAETAPEPAPPSYRELSRRPDESGANIPTTEAGLPPDSKVLVPQPDRWDLDLPSWKRFNGRPGDFPWNAGSHWFDPFNVNRFKGDKPIIGQKTFFDFNGTSSTALDVRNLFVPSGVSAQQPGSFAFFGKGGQVFLAETLRFTFDLFHGDTSFKPTDWRIQVTPAVNVNQIWTRERGIVNIDVREGTSRTDGHVGLQEAFVEKKLADLGPNYDFISLRAGIQQFQSDFRGLIFADEQPGIRLFGNLHSNRLQYNAAYFWFLEKDTNSGLNKFANRHQQVLLANFYMQDFGFPGYTAQFSYHYDKDDASLHYDENGFLVRPAPIGAVKPHNIRAHYIGWAGEGHIRRINVSHAFYQALGDDDLNPIAGRHTEINAQLATLELSWDRDWLRFRASGLFASGDSNPRDGTARGFDSINDSDVFAGGLFSFFNRESLRLTGTGVALNSPDSFLPDLRSSKEEGQANFVNPGLFLVNAGVDAKLTPKVKAVVNVNYLRFHHTAPLDLLLFQSGIKPSLGTDYSLGIVFRPPLSENIVVTGGVAALTPGEGLRQIYTGKTVFSAFSVVRFRF